VLRRRKERAGIIGATYPVGRRCVEAHRPAGGLTKAVSVMSVSSKPHNDAI
jgi:hypothetical protein